MLSSLLGGPAETGKVSIGFFSGTVTLRSGGGGREVGGGGSGPLIPTGQNCPEGGIKRPGAGNWHNPPLLQQTILLPGQAIYRMYSITEMLRSHCYIDTVHKEAKIQYGGLYCYNPSNATWEA